MLLSHASSYAFMHYLHQLCQDFDYVKNVLSLTQYIEGLLTPLQVF